jgi:hypothetical protein
MTSKTKIVKRLWFYWRISFHQTFAYLYEHWIGKEVYGRYFDEVIHLRIGNTWSQAVEIQLSSPKSSTRARAANSVYVCTVNRKYEHLQDYEPSNLSSQTKNTPKRATQFSANKNALLIL